MAFGKRNQVSVNILDYNIMLLGESGAGKTSLINDVPKPRVETHPGQN